MAELEMGAHSIRQRDKDAQQVSGSIIDEGDAPQTTIERLKEKIVQALPQSSSIDVGDLDKLGWALRISVLHMALYAVLLLYFVVAGTLSEMGKKFLALEEPDSALAKCQPVPVAVTGTYLADRNGRWSSHKEYDKSKPLYQLDLTASLLTPEAYTAAMQRFASQVQAIGERQQGYDVISSLIAWDAFRAVADKEASMQFWPYSQIAATLTGVRMSTSYLHPVLASKEGVCDTSYFESPTYSNADMLLNTPFPEEPPATLLPTASPSIKPTPAHAPSAMPTPSLHRSSTDDSSEISYEPCPDQISVRNYTLGIRDSSTHSFDVDMRTVLTAFALNMGIIDISALTAVFTGSGYTIYTSDNYPEMHGVWCYNSPGKPRACLALADMTLIYPVVTTTSYTSEESNGRICSCPQDKLDWMCNRGYQLQVALVFSKKNSDEDTNEMGWRLQQMIADDPVNGPDKVRALVLGLANTATFVQTFSFDNKQKWKQGRYPSDGRIPSYASFAAGFASLGRDLSIITYALNIDGNEANINGKGVGLDAFATSRVKSTSTNDTTPQAMCQDTLYKPAALAAMAATPPVPLVQPYLSCHATARSALVTAAGLAAGNAALVSTLFLTLAIALLIQYTNAYNKAHKVVPPARKALMERRKDRAEKDELRAMIGRLEKQNEGMLAAIAKLQQEQDGPSQSQQLDNHKQQQNQQHQQQPQQQAYQFPQGQHRPSAQPAVPSLSFFLPVSGSSPPPRPPPRRPSQQRPSLSSPLALPPSPQSVSGFYYNNNNNNTTSSGSGSSSGTSSSSSSGSSSSVVPGGGAAFEDNPMHSDARYSIGAGGGSGGSGGSGSRGSVRRGSLAAASPHLAQDGEGDY